MPGHIGVGVHGSGGDSWSVQLVQGPRPSGGGPGVNVPAASIHPVTCGSGSGSPQEPQLVVRTRVTGEQSSVRHSETVATAGEQHTSPARSEEHTSELQSRPHLVCRLLLEKKNM